MKSYIRAAVIIIATFGAGILASFFVGAPAHGWYAGLQKPPLTPPDLVFPIIWIALYALMGIAASIVWLIEPQNSHTEIWLRFYFAHLLFNAGWVIFFFGFRAIFFAFVTILFLNFWVFALIVSAWEIDKRVSYLLMPYLAWLLFAFYLNLGVWVLN
jgi:tryptophan-rich sensory protein